MHYNEAVLENEITKAKVKPTVRLNELDFTKAFYCFIYKNDIVFDDLKETEISKNAEMSYTIVYAGGEKRTIYIKCEQENDLYIYTFYKTEDGYKVNFEEDTEVEEENYDFYVSNRDIFCAHCKEKLGTESSLELGVTPKKHVTVNDTQVSIDYDRDARINLQVTLICPVCKDTVLYENYMYIE